MASHSVYLDEFPKTQKIIKTMCDNKPKHDNINEWYVVNILMHSFHDDRPITKYKNFLVLLLETLCIYFLF